jgi:hypothetical protein
MQKNLTKSNKNEIYTMQYKNEKYYLFDNFEKCLNIIYYIHTIG